MSAAAPVLTLSRDEMRARALAFAKRWQGPQREEADAKSFLDEFFDVLDCDRSVAMWRAYPPVNMTF